MEEKSPGRKIGTFLVFAGPSTIAFLAVVIIPFFYGIYLTFTNWDGISSTKTIIGLANYQGVMRDSAFWRSMLLTLGYSAVSVILINTTGFIMALMLSAGIKGQNIMRAGFFTPNLIGGIVLGFIWRFIFDQIIVALGKGMDAGLFRTSWLSGPSTAFWAMVIVTVWQYAGYMMIIYVAGISGIPPDIKEAASIDGCTGFAQLRLITLPLMVPSFVVCMFLSVSRTFMTYDLNLSLTKGGPFGSTVLAAMHVYQKAFTSKEYGVGQAEALMLFIVVALITATQTYIGKRKEVEA